VKIKRLIDIFVALSAMVLFCIPFLILILIIYIKIGAPVVFSQMRPGKHAKPFLLVKFRTMTDARDSNGQLLSDADRLTDFGRFLRASSLDELPELWNVLKGDMSLVGPRPLLMAYLPLYSAEQSFRHNVRPGITGWAQVNGRNNLSWEERFKLDVWYVRNYSMLLDIKILWMTVRKVLLRDGISATGEATMSAFTGSDNINRIGKQ